jgi:hypothetical protein
MSDVGQMPLSPAAGGTAAERGTPKVDRGQAGVVVTLVLKDPMNAADRATRYDCRSTAWKEQDHGNREGREG